MKILTLPEYTCKKITVPESGISMNMAASPWSLSESFSPFVLTDGSSAASRKTYVKMFWNEKGLYLLFKCEDPCIWGYFENHNDRIFDEEVVEVFININPDDDLYYELDLSPKNVLFTALIRNEGLPDYDSIEKLLDRGEIESKVIIDGVINDPLYKSRSWSAFIRIPFSMVGLDSPPKNGDVWRINLYRIDRPFPDVEDPDIKDEFSCWSPTCTIPAAFHRPDHFGKLIFKV
jgi:cellulose/xylan binding protein with CBM9 domain